MLEFGNDAPTTNRVEILASEEADNQIQRLDHV